VFSFSTCKLIDRLPLSTTSTLFYLKLRQLRNLEFNTINKKDTPVSVAARSKTLVCSRSPAEIVGSNPAGGMDVCLLRVLCVVRYRPLRRADHSSRGVLPTVVRRCV